MSYPHDQLTDTETVLVQQHPHWKVLLLPLVAAAGIVAGCGYLAALLAPWSGRHVAWIALAVLGGIAALWLGVAPWLRWQATHFVLTTDRVMFREGIFTRSGMHIPVSRISSVRVEIDLNDRLFGCGSLVIESHAGGEALRFTDIPAVEQVHTLLHQVLDGTASQHLPTP